MTTDAAATPNVALLGTGRMGAPMGARLLGGGYVLTVWNRTPEKAAELLASGALRGRTAAEAAGGADIVLLMLTDEAAVAEVLFSDGVAGALRPGALVVDMSTIDPAAARKHSARLADLEIGSLDAPVSGGTRGARDGSLTIFVGGEAPDFGRARPVLEVLGRPHLLGPSGSGQVAKCANQLIVAVTIDAVAEAFMLGGSAGLDVAGLREALMGGFADSRVLREHGERMLRRDFEPGGTVVNQVKDMRAIMATAQAAGVDLPVAELVTSLYSGAAAGFGDLDHSALLLELERLNQDNEGNKGAAWISG